MERNTATEQNVRTLVYCEDGGLNSELKALEKKRVIQIVTFPYECISPRNKPWLTPAGARPDDLNKPNVKIKDVNYRIDDFMSSHVFHEILAIVGKANYLDALHIDTAYKNGCRVFFSRDKRDIISRKNALEQLLDIRFFHSTDDWGEFVEVLKAHQN